MNDTQVTGPLYWNVLYPGNDTAYEDKKSKNGVMDFIGESEINAEETHMSARQKLRWEVFAAESGIAFEILFTVFWGFFGHNLPPAAPSLTGPQLAAHFAAHRNAILFGNSMAALVAVLWIPWTAQLTVVMRRIEGTSSVLSIIELAAEF